MSAPLNKQQLAAVRRALRNTLRTASAETVQFVAEFVDDARGAEPDSPRWRSAVGVLVEQAGPVLRRLLDTEAEVDRLRAERDAFADRVDTLTAVAKSNKRAYAEMYAELSAAESRGRALGHVAGLREAAEMIDVDDDCDCGGCDSCTSRQDAARIRAHADLLTAAGGGA